MHAVVMCLYDIALDYFCSNEIIIMSPIPSILSAFLYISSEYSLFPFGSLHVGRQ